MIYRDMFVYPNNSIYRGQMKKKDETNKKMLDNGSQRNSANGRMSYDPNSQDDESIMEFRHGYGI